MAQMRHLASVIAVLGLLPGAAAGAAAGDPQAGARQFFLCGACHAKTAAEPAKTGPSLAGAYGHKAAAADPRFAYSAAMKASGLTWNDRNLDAWLSSPAKLVPGTKMAFAGIADAKTRADLIAYLKQLAAPAH